MDSVIARRAGYFWNRDRQDKKRGSTTLTCPQRNAELRNLESWRDHVTSDLQHQQRQLTKHEVDNTFSQMIQTSTKAKSSRNTRKRCAGDASAPSNVAEPGYDARRTKRGRLTPAGPQTPSRSSHNRSRARNDYDHGRPRKSTSRWQLWIQEDDAIPKTPQKQARTAPIISQTQAPPSKKSTAVPQSSPQPRKDGDPTPAMTLQPETRPISQDQLVAEVYGIYAGLIMVEARCIEVDNAGLTNVESSPKLNNDQWQALVALHSTLLHEHHDFFLASQHPSASPALRRLASEHAMPARMWYHGIHSFLEFLRHGLPASLEHMLNFLYLAYSTVAILYETVPAFQDMWIEFLGDLGRYRMAIEGDCTRDRGTWAGVSRHWYSKASDKSPATGRLYHHLAILARPNALQQLFYYTKSLCGLIPFPGARESIMTLLDPALSEGPNCLAPIDAEFLRVHGILFSGKSKEKLQESMDKFIEQLDPYIERVAEQWLDVGYHIGISLGCSLLGYGAESNALMRAMSQKPEEIDVAAEANPDETFKQALGFTVRITETVMQRWGDTNTLPFLHTMLVFVNHMTRFPVAISHIEGMFPWKRTSLMLNFVLNSLGLKYDVRSDFRLPENDQLPRPLPEDFAMRGLIYTEDYYPHGWFDNGNIEGRERYFELGSMTRERKDRLITLGYRIAASGRWLIWNEETRSFTVPKKYDTAIEDPPEPTRDVSKTNSDSPQSKTLHPGRQYRLKLICVRLRMAQNEGLYFIYCLIFSCVANLERKRHSKIHEAIEELSRFWESLDGSGKLDDSSSSCVFGCTYMAMGIQLELEGESDLAASYEAEAKACFEKALRNSSQYAVRVSTTGITPNENVGEEAWSQLEQWLRNYNSWFVNRGSEIGSR